MNGDSVKTIVCHKYRLYPTKAQTTALNAALDTLRLVYNSLLNERKFLYETTGKGISQYGQEKHFAEWRKRFPELKDVHSHLLQNAALRVNLAFTAFFRRVKAGETPGYPRLKGIGQYDPFCFKEWGNGVSFKNGSLAVSKIGEVKCRVHRPLIGTPKTACIERRGGKWYVCLACEAEPETLPKSEEAVGLDAGLNSFLALSDGSFVANPRFFRRDEKALAKAQRRLSRQKKGSAARRKARKVVTRVHERIRNRRHDFVHQTARRLVDRFGVMAAERLNVRGMVKNHCLAKPIADASWSMFRSVLTSKAESAGRQVVAVDPAYTSQDCHSCGYRARKKLSERWHHCPVCGASLDRDTNAAINILHKAIHLCGATQSQEYTPVEAAGL